MSLKYQVTQRFIYFIIVDKLTSIILKYNFQKHIVRSDLQMHPRIIGMLSAMLCENKKKSVTSLQKHVKARVIRTLRYLHKMSPCKHIHK